MPKRVETSLNMVLLKFITDDEDLQFVSKYPRSNPNSNKGSYSALLSKLGNFGKFINC